MTKFVIFLIYASIALQNLYEVKSETVNEASNEVKKVLKESEEMIDSIKLEEDYFFNNHTEHINKVVSTVDPISEFEKLKNTINKINEMSEEKSVPSCTYDAWNMTYDSLKEHESSKDECSSKTHNMNYAIINLLDNLWKDSLSVTTEIRQEFAKCVTDKDKPDSDKIICLHEVAKVKSKVTSIKKDFTEQKPVYHKNAAKSLKDLEACLKKIQHFSSKEKYILDELHDCIENAATNIFSQSIVLLCCLFGLLRMI